MSEAKADELIKKADKAYVAKPHAGDGQATGTCWAELKLGLSGCLCAGLRRACFVSSRTGRRRSRSTRRLPTTIEPARHIARPS
eukprot:scaffold3183_cov381-Prasinococcus_capsulatus_cf.AAC.4